MKADKLSHYAVVFIALTAVFISIWQGRLMQKHNELTVRPYFNFTKNMNNINGDISYELQLANQGYGPGIMIDYSIIVNGESYGNWTDALSQLGLESLMTRSSSYEEGDVYASNQRQIILRMIDFDQNHGHDIRIVIKYKSIYEEEFEISTTI